MDITDILILKLNSEQNLSEEDKLAISGILNEYGKLIKNQNQNYVVEMSPDNFRKYIKLLSNN